MKATRYTLTGGAEKPQDSISGREPKALAQKRFSGFKPEPEKPVREAQVKDDKVQIAFRKLWNAWKGPDGMGDDSEYYSVIRKSSFLKTIDYAAADVDKFCVMLSSLPNNNDIYRFSSKAGLFLSALISRCKDKEITLTTSGLDFPLHKIGFRNRKKITVLGDAGDCVGEEMNGGTIIVQGSCGGNAGRMMVCGVIRIARNAGANTGAVMDDGEIHVGGKCGGIGDVIFGGAIFEKGQLIHEGERDD